MTENKIKYKSYVKASFFKRLAAFLMDLVLVVVGFMLSASLVSLITNNIPLNQKAKEEYQQIALESHLFIENDGDLTLVSDDIDQALCLFYEDYDRKNSQEDTYEKIKEESSLFILDEHTGLFVENASEESLNSFYQEELTKAYNLFLDQEEVYKYTNIINAFSLVSMGISIFIPVCVIWLIIPLCLKDGASLGKKMVGLSYVSTKSPGNKVTKGAIVLNFIAFTVICLMLSLPLYGIPLLVNMLFIALNKNGFGIADYYTGMVMVDRNRFYSNTQNVKEVVIEIIPSKDGKENILDEFA